ncbi:hypothetical protein V5E38_02385 [Rossellomorea sp. GAMAL-10_SWC]
MPYGVIYLRPLRAEDGYMQFYIHKMETNWYLIRRLYDQLIQLSLSRRNEID